MQVFAVARVISLTRPSLSIPTPAVHLTYNNALLARRFTTDRARLSLYQFFLHL